VPSSSHPSREARLARIEQFDGHAFLRNKLREIARERGDWAGIPMPLDGERLMVEPNYPNAEALMAIGAPPALAADAEYEGYEMVNRWHCASRRCSVLVFHGPAGQVTWGIEPEVHSLPFALSTLNCAEAWGIEQESNAVQLLGTLIGHRQFKQYMLTGMFLERSQRSGVHYLFRRLRPTVAIVADEKRGGTRILCTLCMHPIAYYRGSWAGAMCPTDDLIAHLMLMRGDEAMFWKRSNQHPSWAPESGL
jgi:hypothetical protein